MERITNVRISTLTKSVSHDDDVSIVSVGLNNGHVFAVDSEGNTHDMGAIIISNIEIVAPQVASEGCGCNTPNANVIAKLLRGVDGVDGITPDMSDYYDKITVDNKLKQKQGSIRDLATIREGAAKGATALQSVPSEYVTEDELLGKGYATVSQVNAKQNIISDLDTIRSGAAKGATALQASDVDSEMSVSSTNPIQNKAFSQAYMQLIEEVGLELESKQNSIHDLQTIREGAAKGATALQEETYKGTVTAVKINGETKNPSDGIVDLGEISGGSADLAGYATEEYVDNAVAEVNVKGEDGYVYSNGEKVDMRIRRSLIPIGTLIPASANLNTIAYLKVGNYYCSQTANAKTITNCPVEVAFSMEVFNPLSENLDDETTAQYTYRIRKITAYNTGVQYIQYCNTSGTAGTWTYGSWYVMPRTSFSLASNKNGGSAVKGASTRGVYIDASGTFQQMGYTIAKSVPSNAVFTDTNTKVTSVGNHYTPAENADAAINAPEGEVVVGLKRDAAGHVVGVASTPMGSGGGEYESNIEDKTLAMPNAVGGIAKGTTISELEGKTYNEMFDDLLFPTVNPTFTAPSASIAFKSYSSTQEVGTTGPTASNFTVGYNAGAITLNGTKQANRGGAQDTTNSFIYVNGSASNKTLPSKVTLGSTTFKYRAAFAEGPQPKNNKGGDYSTPLAASYVDSSAITLNGTYPWYASTVGVTTSSPVAKQALVAWNATAGKMYTGDNGFTLEASGTVPQVIKVPNSRTIASMEMYDTGAEKWKAVSMSGTWAASTETISVNGTNITYTVYTYSGATRGQVKLRIKF